MATSIFYDGALAKRPKKNQKSWMRKLPPFGVFFLRATPHKGCSRQKTGRLTRFVRCLEKTVRDGPTRFVSRNGREKCRLKGFLLAGRLTNFRFFCTSLSSREKKTLRAALPPTVKFSAGRNPAQAPIATVGTSLRSRIAREKGGLLEK